MPHIQKILKKDKTQIFNNIKRIDTGSNLKAKGIMRSSNGNNTSQINSVNIDYQDYEAGRGGFKNDQNGSRSRLNLKQKSKSHNMKGVLVNNS